MHDTPIPVLDNKGLRDFGLVTGGIIAALFGLFFPWFLDLPMPAWPFVLGGLLAAWGLIHPPSLRPVYTCWMKFGLLLGRITTPIIMGIVFFLVIFPMGLVMRLGGKDPLARKLDPGASSYRVTGRDSGSSMERPF